MSDETITTEHDRSASELELLRAQIDTLTRLVDDRDRELARLKKSYMEALEKLQLLARRLSISKAERVDPDQLAFDAAFLQLQQLEKEIAEAEAALDENEGTPPREDRKDKPKRSPSGRRDIDMLDLPEKRVETLDPALEGVAERIGFKERVQLGYQRGGPCKVVLARAVYKEPSDAQTSADSAEPTTNLVIVPTPRELYPRGMLAASMIAHVLANKYALGLPFYRQEQAFALVGVPLDRATMCRYAEHIGASLGAIVEAMKQDAIAHAFCLSTDATGICIQPIAREDRAPQPCRKGHFFVVLADKDHVVIEYTPKHNGDFVRVMFRGFRGYIQADAHVIYDTLFKASADASVGPPPKEVGCWSHARRYFWEAAVCKHALGTDGLRKIAVLFAIDAKLDPLAPAQRKAFRDKFLRPEMDNFFAWVRQQQRVVTERGLVASALGYASRQESALCRVLEDGRLKLDNNGAERALRPVAVGRKNWMFCGSDDHASATGNLLSLVASCRLHRLDPERYLDELIRVMPGWPRERYLELCPRDWARTRARLDANELDRPVGAISVPPATAEQQTDTS